MVHFNQLQGGKTLFFLNFITKIIKALRATSPNCITVFVISFGKFNMKLIVKNKNSYY